MTSLDLTEQKPCFLVCLGPRTHKPSIVPERMEGFQAEPSPPPPLQLYLKRNGTQRRDHPAPNMETHPGQKRKMLQEQTGRVLPVQK